MARTDGYFLPMKIQYIISHFVLTAVSYGQYRHCSLQGVRSWIIYYLKSEPKNLNVCFNANASNYTLGESQYFYLSVWKMRGCSSLDLWLLSVWRVSLLKIGTCMLSMSWSGIWERRERRTSCKWRTSAQSRKWLKVVFILRLDLNKMT